MIGRMMSPDQIDEYAKLRGVSGFEGEEAQAILDSLETYLIFSGEGRAEIYRDKNGRLVRETHWEK